MRVFLTGGSGYLGARLIGALAARGWVDEIVSLDVRPPPERLAKLTHVDGSVTADFDDLLAPPFDVALHLAWSVDPLRDARRQREICIGGTERFLRACAKGRVPRVLFFSSATAYGAHPDNRELLDESSPLRPEFHFQYSAEKREAEGLVDGFARAHPDAIVQVVRPTVVAGPGVDNFIFRTIRQRLSVRPRGASPRLQLVHEDDVAAAVVAIIESKLRGAFNLAADGEVTLDEVYARLGVVAPKVPLALMRAALGLLFATGLGEAPANFAYFVAYPWRLSNRRLKDEVGYRPRYDARQTFEAYLETHPPGR